MKHDVPEAISITQQEFASDLFRLLYGEGLEVKEYVEKHYRAYVRLGLDSFPEPGDIDSKKKDIFGYFVALKSAITDKDVYWLRESIPKYTDFEDLHAFIGIFPDKDGQGLGAEVAGNNRTFLNWLTGKTNSFKDVEEHANRFAYMIMKKTDVDTKDFKDTYRKWLTCLGIEEIGDYLFAALTSFNMENAADETVDYSRSRKIELKVVKDRASIFFGLVLFTLFNIVGKNLKNNTKYVDNLYRAMDSLFDDEIMRQKTLGKRLSVVQESFKFSQKALFDCIKAFEPRSISSDEALFPEDYYVPAEFMCLDGGVSNPIAAFADAQTSCRRLIYAKTGTGKSMYMQMLALCMLMSTIGKDGTVLSADSGRREKIQTLAGVMGVPEDCFVISIPAKMYSFLYSGGNRVIYKQDFAELFFDAMWKSSSKYNFYSLQNFESEIPRSMGDLDWVYDEVAESVIDSYARKGKLILLLDSFDEIAPGDMRDKYLASMGKFCDKYCKYTDGESIGAHVLLTTRQMSDDTMKRVKEHLGISGASKAVYTISPLGDSAKRKLIEEWYDGEDRTVDEVFDFFRDNHFYSAYSVNPYMLSVACSSYDKGENLGDITKKFINTLIERMRSNHSSEDYEVQGVFSEIKAILKEVATSDVIKHRKIIDREFLRGQIRGKLSPQIDPEKRDEILDRLLDIFVTEAGIIVPADGNDSAYQFINEQIRYELAVDRFKDLLIRRTDDPKGVYSILAIPTCIEEYVGLVVPLVCAFKSEYPEICKIIIDSLVAHGYENAEEEKLLVRAMLDLIIKRYSENITTVDDPAYSDRAIIIGCQRSLLIRILSSVEFRFTDSEKKYLLESSAYCRNKDYIGLILANFNKLQA